MIHVIFLGCYAARDKSETRLFTFTTGRKNLQSRMRCATNILPMVEFCPLGGAGFSAQQWLSELVETGMNYTDLKWHRVRRHFANLSVPTTASHKPLLILALTDASHEPESDEHQVASTHLVRILFEDCTPDLIKALLPDFVVTPLSSIGFDCLDVAHLLHEADYQGRLRILTNRQFDRATLLTEIYACAPTMDTAIIDIGREFTGNID